MPTTAKVIDYQRIIGSLVPGGRFKYPEATWQDYLEFANAIGDGGRTRLAFDGSDIELMVVGIDHEDCKTRIDLLITIVAWELKIKKRPVGSTTWKRDHLKRAIEADTSYYFDHQKIKKRSEAKKAGPNNIVDSPNPDLVVEIDISKPKIDRQGIYEALEVPELWIAEANTVKILQLGPNGKYQAATRSQFLPVTDFQLTNWIFGAESQDEDTWEERLREWAKTLDPISRPGPPQLPA
jgi:Uma2 family endonuclease